MLVQNLHDFHISTDQKNPFTSKWVYHYQLPTGKTYYYNSNKS